MIPSTPVIIQEAGNPAPAETLDAIKTSLGDVADLRFLLVARDSRYENSNLLIQILAVPTIGCISVLFVASQHPASFWLGALYSLGLFAAIVGGIWALTWLISRIFDGADARTTNANRAYGLTGTHLHKVVLRNGSATRTTYTLADARRSVRTVEGKFMSYALTFPNGGVDLTDLPVTPAIDRLLMQPVSDPQAATAAAGDARPASA